jgi:hypothetical protein
MGTERCTAPPAVRPGRRAVFITVATLRRMALACITLFLLPFLAQADSMRCGSRIVKDGDTIEKVLAVCGEPTTEERTWIQRAPQYELGDQWYSFPGTEDVPVDLWTYDFGPNKLVRRVRFVAGRVQSVVTLDRGGK